MKNYKQTYGLTRRLIKQIVVAVLILISVSISAQIDSSKVSSFQLRKLREINRNKLRKIKSETNCLLEKDNSNKLVVKKCYSTTYYDTLGREIYTVSPGIKYENVKKIENKREYKYFYDENNLMIETIFIDSMGKYVTNTKYKYNEHYDIIEKLETDKNGVIIEKNTYEHIYNANNNILKRIKKRDSVIEEIYMYKYHKNNVVEYINVCYSFEKNMYLYYNTEAYNKKNQRKKRSLRAVKKYNYNSRFQFYDDFDKNVKLVKQFMDKEDVDLKIGHYHFNKNKIWGLVKGYENKKLIEKCKIIQGLDADGNLYHNGYDLLKHENMFELTKYEYYK